jgi:hypothetical protein
MHDYLITFELSAPLDQYRYLSFKLTALRAQRTGENAWLVSLDEDTASILTADLTALLRDNDRLRIVRVDGGDSGSFDSKQLF